MARTSRVRIGGRAPAFRSSVSTPSATRKYGTWRLYGSAASAVSCNAMRATSLSGTPLQREILVTALRHRSRVSKSLAAYVPEGSRRSSSSTALTLSITLRRSTRVIERRLPNAREAANDLDASCAFSARTNSVSGRSQCSPVVRNAGRVSSSPRSSSARAAMKAPL